MLFPKHIGVSKNRGPPKWMVYNGKPHQNGWFEGKHHYFRKHPYWNSWNSNLTAQQLLHIATKIKAEAQCPAIQFTLLPRTRFFFRGKVLHWLESKCATLHFMFYKSRWIQIWIPKSTGTAKSLIEMDFFAPLILLLPVSWQTYLKKHSSKMQEKRDRIRRGVNKSVSIAVTGGFQPIWKICLSKKSQLVWSPCLDQVQRRHVKLLCYYVHKRSCSAFPVAGSCSDPQAYAAAEICFSPQVAPLGSLASLPEHWSLQVSNE